MPTPERPRIGLLDVRDLTAHPWDRIRGPQLVADAQLEVSTAPSFRAVEPPPCVIVVADALLVANLAPFIGWLAASSSVHVVRDWRDDPTPDDPEMNAMSDAEWKDLLAPIRRVTIHDRRGTDVKPLHDALARARAESGSLPAWPEDRMETTLSVLAPGPWVSVADPVSVGHVTHDGQRAYVLDVEGKTQRPLDGSIRHIESRDSGLAAALPDGTGFAAFASRVQLEIRSITGELRNTVMTFPHTPIGFDRATNIAWVGHRLLFFWLYANGDRMGTICAAEHAWPSGHAKKLFGHDNNEPVFVQVSPRLDAYLSVFERDAIVASSVAASWAIAGDVAWLRRAEPDPLRAVFFTSDAEQRKLWQASLTDEDARVAPPVIVLGPSDAIRYAIAPGDETYRLVGETAHAVQAPAGSFLICDAAHHVVREASGRLLGGSSGMATLANDGNLYREDLTTGVRVALGPIDRTIAGALPIPGTENVLLLSDEDEDRVHVRVV